MKIFKHGFKDDEYPFSIGSRRKNSDLTVVVDVVNGCS
jgi:hypothetical protein